MSRLLRGRLARSIVWSAGRSGGRAIRHVAGSMIRARRIRSPAGQSGAGNGRPGAITSAWPPPSPVPYRSPTVPPAEDHGQSGARRMEPRTGDDAMRSPQGWRHLHGRRSVAHVVSFRAGIIGIMNLLNPSPAPSGPGPAPPARRPPAVPAAAVPAPRSGRTHPADGRAASDPGRRGVRGPDDRHLLARPLRPGGEPPRLRPRGSRGVRPLSGGARERAARRRAGVRSGTQAPRPERAGAGAAAGGRGAALAQQCGCGAAGAALDRLARARHPAGGVRERGGALPLSRRVRGTALPLRRRGCGPQGHTRGVCGRDPAAGERRGRSWPGCAALWRRPTAAGGP